MIIISDIKEIENYKTQEIKSEKKQYKKIKVYEFKEEGKLCDVVFKCDALLGFLDFWPEIDMEEFDKNFGNPDYKLEEEPYDAYYFCAKNVVFEKTANLHTLIAENVKIEGDSVIEFLHVSNNLECNKIYSFELSAKNIVANIVDVCDSNFLSFKTLKAKELHTPKLSIKNVTCEGYFFDEE